MVSIFLSCNEFPALSRSTRLPFSLFLSLSVNRGGFCGRGCLYVCTYTTVSDFIWVLRIWTQFLWLTWRVNALLPEPSPPPTLIFQWEENHSDSFPFAFLVSLLPYLTTIYLFLKWKWYWETIDPLLSRQVGTVVTARQKKVVYFQDDGFLNPLPLLETKAWQLQIKSLLVFVSTSRDLHLMAGSTKSRLGSGHFTPSTILSFFKLTNPELEGGGTLQRL